jgi:hypothetical protein
MRCIFTCEIKKKYIFMNKKIILPFRKLKFETQLNMGFSAKGRSYLAIVVFKIVVIVVF